MRYSHDNFRSLTGRAGIQDAALPAAFPNLFPSVERYV